MSLRAIVVATDASLRIVSIPVYSDVWRDNPQSCHGSGVMRRFWLGVLASLATAGSAMVP